MSFIVVAFIASNAVSTYAADYDIKDRTLTIPDEEVAADKVEKTSDFMVNLSGSDLILEGLNDRIELYYDVPVQGVADGSTLKLNVYYSELLLDSSTISVAIDDKVVTSKTLDHKKQKMAIDVKLPKDARTAGFHHVTIIFDGHISKDVCANEESPANWLTIHTSSHLSLKGAEMTKRDNALADYPHPFIQTNDEATGASTIVIPDDASADAMHAALQLSTYLQSNSLSNHDVPIVTESALGKLSTNIIAVGEKDAWSDRIQAMMEAADPKIKEDHLTMRNYYLQMDDATKQLLFVTAPDDATIKERIHLLTTDTFVEQLTGDELVIKDVPHSELSEPKEMYSFKQMNIPTLELNGEQKQSQHYFFELPTQTDRTAGATLHMKVKASEPLRKKETGELVVYVNDVPHSIAADDLQPSDDDSYTHVSLKIDEKTLQSRKVLSIQLKGNGLEREEICAPVTTDKWLHIDDDSALQISLASENTEESPNFHTWPYPFGNDQEEDQTLVILPEVADEPLMKQLQLLFQSFTHTGERLNVQLIQSADVTEDDLTNYHVIILGHMENHPQLQEMIDDPLLPVTDEGLYDLSAYDMINETSAYIGWIQRSVWNDQYTLAHFAATSADDETFMTKRLANFLTDEAMDATIIVENINGDIFTNEVDDVTIGTNETDGTGEPFNFEENRLLVIGFIAILLLGIVVYIIFYRSTKKNK